jgi:hypothetical protein
VGGRPVGTGGAWARCLAPLLGEPGNAVPPRQRLRQHERSRLWRRGDISCMCGISGAMAQLSSTTTCSLGGRPQFDACPSTGVGWLRDLHRWRGVGGCFHDGVQRDAAHQLSCAAVQCISREHSKKWTFPSWGPRFGACPPTVV